MILKQPIDRQNLAEKSQKKYQSLMNLINSLNQKELTEEFVEISNAEIEFLNSMGDSDSNLMKSIRKTYSKISNRAVSKLKYVNQGYYKTLWMSLGMAMFGVPFGTVFGFALDSMAFLGLGLPIGMSIGIAIGAGLDKKAEAEGRIIGN